MSSGEDGVPVQAAMVGQASSSAAGFSDDKTRKKGTILASIRANWINGRIDENPGCDRPIIRVQLFFVQI